MLSDSQTSSDGEWMSASARESKRSKALPTDAYGCASRAQRGELEQLAADVLLVATGRTSNGDTLDLAYGGIEADDDGLIIVDEYQRTTADGVFRTGRRVLSTAAQACRQQGRTRCATQPAAPRLDDHQ